ncbi:MAG TPA: BPSS1780 family membrane protein [Burkholderiales bacterium]|nr:BPSS1780 family membrane protein [Burkholderiales bacterium]
MTTNPYSAPAATVADPALAVHGDFVPGGRGVAAGRGWTWITEGWSLFKEQPWMWIGIWVALAVILLVLNFIPLLGPIANAVLWPIFSAGLALGCRALSEGEPLEFGHLFAGFRERLGTLAGVGAVTLAISFAIGMVVAIGMGVGFATMFGGATPETPEAGMAALLAGLVMLALMLPLFMAVWFAPMLVVFHERGVLEAMKESFQGCLRNIVPFLVYGAAGFVLMVLASVPVLLGWLVLGPVMIASIYTAYRDIYFKA